MPNRFAETGSAEETLAWNGDELIDWFDQRLLINADDLLEEEFSHITASQQPGPTHLGRYRIINSLACNEHAAVYRGWHPELMIPVAIKIAHDDEESWMGDLITRHEGLILAQLDHPGLVRVLDLDTDDAGRPFLVMEHIDGVTFDQWIETHPTFDEVLDVLDQLLETVAYLHAADILHLDLHPGNVLLTPKGRTKLIDFGLARKAGLTPLVTGFTPGFTAPELQESPESATPQCDVFSLGAIAEFLCSNASQVVHTPNLRAVIAQAQAIDPQHRYSSVDQLQSAWQGIRRGPVVGPWLSKLAAAAALLTGLTMGPLPDPHRRVTIEPETVTAVSSTNGHHSRPDQRPQAAVAFPQA